MPATHSKPAQKKNAETTNHRRKWEKKLRYAKTEEQRLKAEQMLRIHTPKEKVPKEKVPKEKELTEDQLLDQMIRKNEKLRNDPEFIEQQTQAELKRLHLDKQRELTREKIKNDAMERKQQEQLQMKKQLEDYEQYKQEEATLNKHLESHKEFLVEFSEKMGVMKTLLEKHEGNKKKAKKEYKAQTVKMCHFFEYMVNGISKEQEVPYNEAREIYYDEIRMSMKKNPNDDLLQLTASL